MSFLFSLPNELNHVVLVDWLNLEDVRNIDSACCTSERAKWLEAVYRPVYNYNHPQFPYLHQPEPSYDGLDPNLPQLVAYMRWIELRSVRITSYCGTQDLATRGRISDYLRTNGVHIKKVCFDENASDNTWQAHSLQEICAHCPNVTGIVLPTGMTLTAIDECIQAWPKLQEIGLSFCSATLLPRIATGFRHLTGITTESFAGNPPDVEKAWVTFFETVNQNLLHVTCQSDIGSNALRVVARRCRQLCSLQGKFSSLDDNVLIAIAKGCPHLEIVDLTGSAVTHNGLTALAQADALTELNMPLLPCEALRFCPKLRKVCLMTLLDVDTVLRSLGAFCPNLEDVTVVSLCVKMDRCYGPAVTAMVRGCRYLQRILLNVNTTDGVLTAIGQHCPHLTNLQFMLRCTATDAGLISLAQSCPLLRQLVLRLCAPITLGGIEALATHCPQLRFLEASKGVVKVDPWGRKGCKLKIKGLTVLSFKET
jgi:hypothetical protein